MKKNKGTKKEEGKIPSGSSVIWLTRKKNAKLEGKKGIGRKQQQLGKVEKVRSWNIVGGTSRTPKPVQASTTHTGRREIFEKKSRVVRDQSLTPTQRFPFGNRNSKTAGRLHKWQRLKVEWG